MGPLSVVWKCSHRSWDVPRFGSGTLRNLVAHMKAPMPTKCFKGSAFLEGFLEGTL